MMVNELEEPGAQQVQVCACRTPISFLVILTLIGLPISSIRGPTPLDRCPTLLIRFASSLTIEVQRDSDGLIESSSPW